MPEPKHTPLFPVYAAYNARVVDYAGWSLPVQFEGIAAEHRQVRNGAGLFDVSHMGEILIAGSHALPFLQYLLPNDCSKLVPGKIIYSPMCYPDGGCVDDLLVYMLGREVYLLVVNAANTAKDLAWILSNKAGFRVTVDDLSDAYAQLALQGPGALEIINGLTDKAGDIKYYWFKREVKIAGHDCLLSRTGYTGEDGFELYTAPENAVSLWGAILQTGRAAPVGLGARDTLRLEASLPLYGHELSPAITPVEAGLARFLAAEKTPYLGADVILEQLRTGPPRTLIGLELETRAVPRADYEVFMGELKVGYVTSGTLSPYSGRPIAMALVQTPAARGNDPLAIRIRDKAFPARRVALPFYQRRRG